MKPVHAVSILPFLAILAILATLSSPPSLLAADDLVVTLTAHRVQTTGDGREALSPADSAKPGDLIEYRAVYRNTGGTTVRNVRAKLPIPPGTEYVADSGRPRGFHASRDGNTFSPPPLLRTVRLADGRVKKSEIPPRDYRALQWHVDSIPAGGEFTATARVRLKSGPPDTGARR